MILDGKSFSGKNLEKRIGKEKLAIFLLWMISRKPQHGYEIIKTLEEDHSILRLPASRIYPILKGLEKKGLITHKKTMQGKRARKIYGITPKGRKVLAKAKEHFKKSRLMTEYAEDLLK
ncbi:hypothetical protein GF318_01085 [Candidatus Micrarchaeota archaeon]|nr:hypothetical protein [Candidatus Micrarchaeota archaeon]